MYIFHQYLPKTTILTSNLIFHNINNSNKYNVLLFGHSLSMYSIVIYNPCSTRKSPASTVILLAWAGFLS